MDDETAWTGGHFDLMYRRAAEVSRIPTKQITCQSAKSGLSTVTSQ